jgi:cation transport ATPase
MYTANHDYAQNIVGQGIKAVVDDHDIMVGSPTWIEQSGVPLNKVIV